MRTNYESLGMKAAYDELKQLISEGYEFHQALHIVKFSFGLKSTFQLEVWYHQEVYILDRTDETLELLADQLSIPSERYANEPVKPSLWERFTAWFSKD